MISKDNLHKIIIEKQVLRNFTGKRAMAQISIDKAMDMKIILIRYLSIKAATTRVSNCSRKNIQEISRL